MRANSQGQLSQLMIHRYMSYTGLSHRSRLAHTRLCLKYKSISCQTFGTRHRRVPRSPSTYPYPMLIGFAFVNLAMQPLHWALTSTAAALSAGKRTDTDVAMYTIECLKADGRSMMPGMLPAESMPSMTFTTA